MAKQAQSLDSHQMTLASTTCLKDYWQFSYVMWTAQYFFIIKAKRLGWSMRQVHGPSRNKTMLSLSIITICSKSKQMGWQGAKNGPWRNWLDCWRSCKNSISVDEYPHGGFTTGEPWMPANDSYIDINAKSQLQDDNSFLSFWRKMSSANSKKIS